MECPELTNIVYIPVAYLQTQWRSEEKGNLLNLFSPLKSADL